MASLMNGLSALGAGVSAFAGAAGLEAQKAGLAQQQAILADQLATTRETGLQASGGVIAAAAAKKAQDAAAANVATEQTAATGRTVLSEAGANARNAATEAGAMARTQATINAPPETIKLLRALGVPLPGAPSPTAAAPAAGSTGASASASDPTTPTPIASGASTGTATPTPIVPGTASGAAAPVADPMDNPIVQKALGYPAAGSEDALRRAVAADVKSDPTFKYKTAGAQAVETELRVNVAKGTMTSPETQAANAAMIASYQIKPPDGFALSRPGAAETMAKVKDFNPDYQESRFPEINKAMSAFGPGPQGNIVRSLDVGVQHLDVIDQAGKALGNTNVGFVNTAKNAFLQQFGYSAPTTFDGLKQIVATEIEKSVAGGIGASGDRDRLIKSLDGAKSPAQLLAMTDGFRSLMAGQLAGLKTQYENDTDFKSGPFAFDKKLGPATIRALALHAGGGPAPSAQPDTRDTPMTPQQMYGGSAPPAATTPATPANPNIIRYDANGNRVAP